MRHPRWSIALFVASALFLCISCATSQPAQAATEANQQTEHRLEQVRGDVYRFVAGHYRSVVLVTDEGIVVTDPINKDAARWLKAELGERFEVPVRYVIYSHSHPDHVYGGEVFAEPGVTFVAHEMARNSMARTKADTHLPDVTFRDSMTLRLGGHVVDLTYHGPNNGKGSVSMHFRSDEVMFVVDWIVLDRAPYKDLPGYDIEGMIESTRQILKRNFKVFVGGHAAMGDKEDIRRYLAYLESLYGQVLKGMRQGKALKTIKREVDLSKYSDLKMFEEWRDVNIEGVYNQLRDEAYMLRRPDVPAPPSGE